jgi:GAF domain-containing protein
MDPIDATVGYQRLADAHSIAEVCDVVRGLARWAAAADGATFVLREDGKCFYADEDSIAPLWKGQRFPIGECISGWSMLNGEVAVVPDISSDDRVPLEAYLPTFVRSLLMVPVGDEPVAALGAYWATQHRATDDEIAGLCEVAGWAADALRRVGLADAPWAPNFAHDMS